MAELSRGLCCPLDLVMTGRWEGDEGPKSRCTHCMCVSVHCMSMRGCVHALYIGSVLARRRRFSSCSGERSSAFASLRKVTAGLGVRVKMEDRKEGGR